MESQKIISLLRQEEGPKLDFKEKLDLYTESGKKELAKDVIAIANTQGGRGYLLIGIKDKTKAVVGVDPREYLEETIQQIIGLRCDPPITLRVEPIKFENKYVVLLTIFRSFNRPHQMRQTGAFYLRRGSTTDYATRDEVAGLLQYYGVINNEQIPLFNMSVDLFDDKLVDDYLERIGLGGQFGNLRLLNNLGILHYDRDSGEYYPTVGGVLLFTQVPQLYLPYTGVRIVDKLGKKTSIRYFNGNVFSMIDEVVRYFVKRNEDTGCAYPIKALEECLINAIIHRDYFDTSRDILINLSITKVVVSNPGSIFGGDNIDAVSREDNPRRRNNWLYNVFLVMDDTKRLLRASNGLRFIKNQFAFEERVRFINVRRSNLFKVVLPGYHNFMRGDSNER